MLCLGGVDRLANNLSHQSFSVQTRCVQQQSLLARMLDPECVQCCHRMA